MSEESIMRGCALAARCLQQLSFGQLNDAKYSANTILNLPDLAIRGFDAISRPNCGGLSQTQDERRGDTREQDLWTIVCI
jgi:hypothetical protein